MRISSNPSEILGSTMRAAVWAICGLLMFHGAPASGATDAAHFWISTSSSGSSGPEAPSFSMTVSELKTLYVWGRPTSGMQLRNVSLNVVASASGLDLKDGTFTVNNTIDVSSDRFEFVDDSSASSPLLSDYTRAEVGAGSTDALYGLGGFTLYPSSSDRGVGPMCTSGESNCETALDSEPAWVLAELVVDAVATGSVTLSLQIGDLGMNEAALAAGDVDYSGTVDLLDLDVLGTNFGSTSATFADGDLNGDGKVDLLDLDILGSNFGNTSTLGGSSSTVVRFGEDAGAGTEPKHNASTDRSTNLPGDDPDATITITSSSFSIPEPGALGLLAVFTAASVPLLRTRRL